MKSVFIKIIALSLVIISALGISVASFGYDENTLEADRNTYRYGLAGYAQRDQIIRNLPKKSVAYVTQILDGSNTVVSADKVTKGSYYRYSLVEGINTFNPEAQKSYGFLGGITYDFFSEADMDMLRQETSADGKTTPYYIVSADELLKADVIVTVGCIPLNAMKDSLGSREYKGIILSDVPAVFSDESLEDSASLTIGYYLGSAFSEVLNPVDLCAYYYERFLGYEGDALKEKVDSAFSSTEFFRGYSNKLGEGYSKDTIEKMLMDGTYFYLDNRNVFSGGAFDTNGMSSWEPDFALAGSILGGGVPESETEEETEVETEIETETETEQVTEAETETETEIETEIETESVTESEAEPETETEISARVQTYELPGWIGMVAGGVVVAAGLIVYIIYIKKKD